MTDDDAAKILEELLPAQNEARLLGLSLSLPIVQVDTIFQKYLDPRERLLYIIVAFLRQAQPKPTWRVIVDALKSPVVNHTPLANRVEAAHFPDPTATRPLQTETGESICFIINVIVT